jgi:hypothetical protein
MVNLTITSPLTQKTPNHWVISDSASLSQPAVGLGTDALISATPEKWSYNYRVWRTRVGTALLEYGMEKEAFQFNGCFEHPVSWIKSTLATLPTDAATVWMCSDNPKHDAALFMPTCDLRICPDCAARATARLAARYIPKAIELASGGGAYHLRHIVFTTPIELTSDTPDKVQQIVKKYSRLPKAALDKLQTLGIAYGRDWKTEGAIQSFEFGTDGLKLHFHVIQYGAYLPQKELSEAWTSVTDNEASVTYIRAINSSSPESIQSDVIETLKYSVKFWSIDKQTNEYVYLEPNLMPHLLRTLKGVRRVKSWGCFYNLPKPEKRSLCCETCESEMVRFGVENWKLWIEQGVTKEHLDALKEREALLHLKLANKSKKATLYESHSPPDSDEKYRQKDMWKPVSHSHYHYEDNL